MRQNNAFSSLLTNVLPSDSANSSSPTGTPQISPTALLETFIPGYGPIHRLILSTLNIDITVVVSLVTVIWLSARIFRSGWAVIWSLLSSYFMAEISVSSTDEIHSHLIAFLAHQYKVKPARRLMAETPSKSAWELDSEDTETPETKVDSEGNIKWLNFSNQEAKSQPRFTPAIGSHNFWHRGTYFQLRRKEVAMFDDLGGGSAAFKDKEVLTLSCFGRSTEPIKTLIQHAKAHFHLGHNAKTIIKRPAAKDMRRFGGRGSWVKIAERPCRPMKTVVLDEDRKMEVLADINEYLNPATARWYANRGIPYRRGYLFYGPPGTGKTSLTFALAGVFGLDIHVVSLLEPTLTEEELGMLFTNLPARCIVLLEDIDTAGLVRNNEIEEEDETEKGRRGKGKSGKDNHGGDEGLNVANLTKALKRANEQSEEEKKKGISLSGLLNIIDGVASHEGRVLVMTTNRPEKLDEALIRPGRVDHQVAFGNATQTQIKELFVRMYTNDLPRTKFLKAISTPLGSVANGKLAVIREKEDLPTPPVTPTAVEHTNGHASAPTTNGSPPALDGHPKVNGALVIGEKDNGEVGEDELKTIARDFSVKVPNDMFSPAEIQGFLLKRKKDPRKALQEVGGWVEGMVEVKRKGTKLVRIQ
ncbi:putative chaperone BCS1-B [Hyphodiscus hymeniophilus]|uniref:Chaperone BCS1-B n=1 Tax=Hyphodiscus hymeniophilus TaxID=353542 RepID=A0A9P6VEK7_9HELO|nr:putative chaperone BCS1-B [Hyphodiscus hymeniophilus]